MIKKKYPTNTPEVKKLSRQAKSRIFTEKNHYVSSLIQVVEFFQTTYTSLNPASTTPLSEIIELVSSINLQVTFSRVSISVLKGRPKRKIIQYTTQMQLVEETTVGRFKLTVTFITSSVQ